MILDDLRRAQRKVDEAMIGARVKTTDALCEVRQYRFPRTKRRRIRAKWAKRPENYREFPSDEIIHDTEHNVMYMHPETWRKLKKEMQSRLTA